MNYKTLVISVSLSVSVFATPSQDRLQQIQISTQKLDAGHLFDHIQISYDESAPGPAVSRKVEGGYEITYNPKILAQLSVAAQTLISYHELGHIVLGHSDMDPKVKDRAKVEFEADAFAAFLYKRLHAIDTDLLAFINFIATQDKTTPPGNERADLFRKLLLTAQ